MSDEELLPVSRSGPRRRGPWIAVALLVGLLLIAGLVWNGLGTGSSIRSPSSSSATSNSAIAAPPVGNLADDGNRCVGQQGTRLILGIEVVNGRATRVDIQQLHVVLPLGGLRVVSLHRSECVWASGALTPFSLEPGQSAWLSAVFDVLVGCPAPLPVQFVVDYSWRLSSEIAELAPSGFADLGELEYTGCATAVPKL